MVVCSSAYSLPDPLNFPDDEHLSLITRFDAPQSAQTGLRCFASGRSGSNPGEGPAVLQRETLFFKEIFSLYVKLCGFCLEQAPQKPNSLAHTCRLSKLALSIVLCNLSL